jgi:hypothetical protein
VGAQTSREWSGFLELPCPWYTGEAGGNNSRKRSSPAGVHLCGLDIRRTTQGKTDPQDFSKNHRKCWSVHKKAVSVGDKGTRVLLPLLLSPAGGVE